MSQKSYSDIIRKWSRLLHRDLSFFFAGILMIYAISGFMLNHKRISIPIISSGKNKFGLPSQSRRIPRK